MANSEALTKTLAVLEFLALTGVEERSTSDVAQVCIADSLFQELES
jgi:hypothetical protein